jgi:hypothetical protein
MLLKHMSHINNDAYRHRHKVFHIADAIHGCVSVFCNLELLMCLGFH